MRVYLKVFAIPKIPQLLILNSKAANAVRYKGAFAQLRDAYTCLRRAV